MDQLSVSFGMAGKFERIIQGTVGSDDDIFQRKRGVGRHGRFLNRVVPPTKIGILRRYLEKTCRFQPAQGMNSHSCRCPGRRYAKGWR